MTGFVDKINFIELPAEKYWSYSKTYKGDSKKETKTMILGGKYLGAEKKDGHYCRLIKDENGNIRMQGRSKSVNGEYLDKHEWLPQLQDFFNFLPNGTVLLGELYFPNQRGSRKVTTILGCLKEKALERQNRGEKLHYYIFDIWAYDNKSFLNSTIEERCAAMDNLRDSCSKYKDKFDCVDFANYSEGDELWNNLGNILSCGGEGIVITKKGSRPEPGKRTARKTLKVKMEVEHTIDAFLTGKYKSATKTYDGKEIETWPYWMNSRTMEKTDFCQFSAYCKGECWEPITKAFYHGWASSVQFGVYKNGELCPIGYISGITDELKKNIVEKTDELTGKVAELSAMEIEHIGNNYSLRHGKIVNWREDKNKEDCDFKQIAE